MPGLQLVEASAENASSSEKVSLDRRTVALIGGAKPTKPAYLLDIFRVVGGRRHDHFLGMQTQEYEVEGLEWGTEQPRS